MPTGQARDAALLTLATAFFHRETPHAPSHACRASWPYSPIRKPAPASPRGVEYFQDAVLTRTTRSARQQPGFSGEADFAEIFAKIGIILLVVCPWTLG